MNRKRCHTYLSQLTQTLLITCLGFQKKKIFGLTMQVISQNLPTNCLKGRQSGEAGAQQPECTLVHEDCEHRPTSNHGLLGNLWTGSKVSAIVAVFCALTSIYGCGQRGPLYLPKVPAPPTDVETVSAPSKVVTSPAALPSSSSSISP